ncbi:hypothetical protein J2Z20_001355 [Paenibacillus sediminis]|uniref:Uncharacterized protein n=1 Tax=Paenibacillus sediminis TaxID=664909 RepID=A0ABS4H1U6_9BACL|nr:hypothetical protein [Paenibacillus sediminis]
MNQRIYQLNKVHNISLSKGKLRTATMDEVDMISKWIYSA